MRTFVLTDAKSDKFWNIDLQGTSFTVTFGKGGTKGQTQVKEFDDEAKALKAHDKLVAEKVAKGYVETTARLTASPLQQSLETALAENPDDLAAHSAYADLLAEQGDPRGELIQVQLALEDGRRSVEERKELREREQKLLKRHAREWLGDPARFLVGDWSGPDKPYHYAFARGWTDHVRMLPAPDALLASLAGSPQSRLLSRLEIVYDMRYHPFDFDKFTEGANAGLKEGEGPDEMYEAVTNLGPLVASPYVTNVRAFRLGYSDNTEPIAHSTMVSPFENCAVEQVIALLEKWPRLEELYLNTSLAGVELVFAHPALGRLRVLQYYFGSGYVDRAAGGAGPYPLSFLAGNASLKGLTTLRLHPGRDATIDIEEFDALLRSPNLPGLTHLQVHMTTFGDDGCRRLVQSGVLRRLKTLDLGYGAMTDEGAAVLAACPDLKRLESLDVSRNALTATGRAALEAAGVRLTANDQHAPGDEEFLFEVDME